MKPKSETLYLAFLVSIIIIAIPGCSSTKLLNINETSTKLSLTTIQLETIRPKIERIAAIVEEYTLVKNTLESEMKEMRNRMRDSGFSVGRSKGGARGDFQNKMQVFYKQRTAFMKRIDTLVSEIRESLNETQREAFAKLKLPDLELPEMGRSSFGGGQRRNGGFGEGGGGGRRRSGSFGGK